MEWWALRKQCGAATMTSDGDGDGDSKPEVEELAAEADSFKEKLDKAALSGEAKEQPTPMEGMEGLVCSIMEELRDDDINSRGPLGQRFRKFLQSHPTENEKYRALKAPGRTVEMKRQFRVQWAQKLKDSCMEAGKTRRVSWHVEDLEQGTYEPFERLVVLEGGKDSRAAWEAAYRYASKAMAMAGTWLRYNPMTERTDILYIKSQHNMVFRKKWEQYQLEQGPVEPKEDEGVAETPQKTKAAGSCKEAKLAEIAAGEAKTKRGREETPRAKAKAKVEKAAPKAKVKKTTTVPSLASAWKEGLANKNQYLLQVAMHHEIMQDIEHDDSFAWANTQEQKQRLTKANNTVTQMVRENAFMRDFVVHGVDVKIRYEPKDLEHHLDEMNRLMPDALQGMQQEQDRFRMMHRANLGSEA